MLMKNSWFADELSEEHGHGACDEQYNAQPSNTMNGAQFDDVLDVLQQDLAKTENRNDFLEGCYQAITLIIDMVGDSDCSIRAFNTYDAMVKKYSEVLEVAV